MNEELMQNMDLYTSKWEFDRVISLITESIELDYGNRPQIKDGSPLPAIASFFDPEGYAAKIKELNAEREKEDS